MKKILVIDDSTTQLLNSKFILRNAGYEVETESDAEKAVEHILAMGPELIITDLNMPKIDGISLVRKVRNMTQHLKTPILIMSTDSQKYKYEEAREAGATGWLVKPVKPASLLEALNRLLPREPA